jgi:hypothetical protein
MSSRFFINKKEYIPSNILCASFGYSKDYVAKLARDEKILGTQIGRQWFIEPESLRTYLLKIVVQKNIQKEELSLVRKRERTDAISQSDVVDFSHKAYSGNVAFAQSVAIMLCGLLLGSLGWILVDEGISVTEISEGAQTNVTQIAGVVSSVLVAQNTFLSSDALVALVSKSDAVLPDEDLAVAVDEVFAILPTVSVSPRVLENTVDANTVQLSPVHFSDEVQIIVDTHGQQLIRPVFKKNREPEATFVLQQVATREQ